MRQKYFTLEEYQEANRKRSKAYYWKNKAKKQLEKEELEQLRLENEELKKQLELERLKNENEQLKQKIEKLENDKGEM